MFLRQWVFWAITSYIWELTLCIEGKDNKGRHFIFGFMDNAPGGLLLEVFITTNCFCTVQVNVTTPLFHPPVSKTLYVTHKQVKNVAFTYDLRGIGTEHSNKGIEIQSSEEITVYAVNKHSATSDAFVVFPVDSLGYTYYAITWSEKPAFLIIATEDNTSVEITIGRGGSPISYNSVSYKAGMTFIVNMNKFQTFQAVGSSSSDYSGTFIRSSKVVSVISGNQYSVIGAGFADHLSSQMTPINTFGKRFVTLKMPNCDVPVNFKIVASENNTNVNIYGKGPVHLIIAGDMYSFRIVDKLSRTIVADKPVAVAFFAEGGCGSDNGDPAMILLPPIEQFAAEYTFSTIKNPGNPFQNALTIIIRSSEINGLLLDGLGVSSYHWRHVLGSTDLQITDVNVAEGSHTIYHSNPTVTFFLASTGIARANGYGYIAGQRLASINTMCNTSMTVPGDIVDNDCDGFIDEELLDGKDNDGDGKIDEDLAAYHNDKDECASNPCLNGGSCKDETNYYNCTCAPGYTGSTCHINIDECAANPCINGGTCVDLINAYNCICLSGYTGKICATDVDECNSSPCMHNGNCTDMTNAYNCSCEAGYAGNNCQTDIDECASNPCMHDGSCVDLVNSYNCTCVSGFTGHSCQIDIDECSSSPCHHNGQCVDLVDDFICRCQTGFSGDNCQVDTNECGINPCLHGGSCRDMINSYVCDCENGYTGDRCQTDVDECSSNPCSNNGTCVDMISGWNCVCPHGFTGNHCETDIDECESNPCQNNGTCVDLPDGYHCVCTNDASGSQCELRIDHCHSMPCLNNGVCNNGNSGFTCNCFDNWYGDICDNRIINRTKGCLDLEYSDCNCFTHQLNVKNPKSHKSLFGSLGFVTGLLVSIISYCAWKLLDKSQARTCKTRPVKDLSKSQKEEITSPSCSDEKSNEKIKLPSESRRKVPAHSSETHNCFVDHTGFDFSKFCVNTDGSRRIPKCRHQKQINV